MEAEFKTWGFSTDAWQQWGDFRARDGWMPVDLGLVVVKLEFMPAIRQVRLVLSLLGFCLAIHVWRQPVSVNLDKAESK